MVHLARPDLIAKLPGWGAAAAAAAVGVGVVAAPDGWLAGAAALLPVGEPPFGSTMRAVLAVGGAVLVAAVVWSALYLLFGEGGAFAPRPVPADGVPAVRRADAHPDAPPRRPLTAAELAEPDPVERPVPADLDLPLAAFDPAAIPAVPREPARALAPLAPGERLQTFALTPPAPKPPVAAEPASIDALLRRLEQGARRRVA